MADKIVKFKLPTLGITDKQFVALPFGRKIEHIQAITAWKARAKVTHLSQKRQSYTKAIREFCKLNNVDEYYCTFYASAQYFDDTFEFFYTVKE